MSLEQIDLDNDDSDWSLIENIKERRGSGTHLPKGAAADELAVSVNTGTLGTGGGALSINAGTAVVDGAEHPIGGETIDIALGESQPRRDVVYISGDGNVEVRRGTPAETQWGPGVSVSQRTIENAFLPAPRSLANISALALCIVYVPGNGTNSLSSDSHTLQDVRVSERGLSGKRLRGIQEHSIEKNYYSKNASFRQGTTVYYDPRDPGPYVDGADALADVPDGGTFRLAATDYDVSSEGRLVHEEAINIEGEGWNTSGPPNHEGTRLLNTGADALDKPVIEFRTGNRGRYEGAEIHSMLIEHEGAGSAIVVDDHPRTEINHLNIVGTGPADVGIEMKGGSYASRVQFCNTANFNRTGYLTSTTGSRVEYYGCYSFTNETGSSCFEVHDQNTMILGGESRAKNGSDGIVFIGDEGSNGGLVLNHLFEDCEVGVKFTGTDFRDTDIWFPHVAYGASGPGGVNTLVEFDTATNCRLWFPQVRRPDTGGTRARFGPNANRCGVVHAGGISRFLNVDVDSAATDCYQMIKAAVPHSHIGDLPTDPNLVWQVDYDIGKNSPAWHDGNRWWYVTPTASFIGPTTTDYAAEHGDTVFADTDANNVTVTLPPAANGLRVTTTNFQSSASGDLFVETADAASVNGQSSVTIGSQGTIYEWFCDGADWWAAV